MAAKGYTTPTKVREFLGLSSLVISVDFYIESAEQIIDQETNRNFAADSADVERLFDGDGSNTLLIDDAISITKLEIGSDPFGTSFTEIVLGGSNGYVKYPSNYAEKLVPITKLILNSESFIRGRQNQKITAKFGYCAIANIPADVSFAATVIAAGIYNFGNASGGSGDIKSESIGNYSVTYDIGSGGGGKWGDFERAKEIIKKYRRHFL